MPPCSLGGRDNNHYVNHDQAGLIPTPAVVNAHSQDV